MGVTFIAPGEQFTSPAKLITKEITENGTYDAADDNANGYSSVEVAVEGGGSSDFSTAQVTIVSSDDCDLYMPVIDTFPIGEGLPPATSEGADCEVNVSSGEPITYTVILYKGYARAIADPYTNIDSASGSAQIVFEQAVITGDCTINVSAALG